MAGETWRVALDDDTEITISIIEGSPMAPGWVASAHTVLPQAASLDHATTVLRVIAGPFVGCGAHARVAVDDRRVTFTGLTPFEGRTDSVPSRRNPVTPAL
jgi:hypothetical protein